MKTLLYIANLRLPTEKAYGIQITKMCEAFVDQGVQVKLVLPTRRNPIKEDIFSYYKIKKNFQIKTLSVPDFYFSSGLDWVSVGIKSFISAIRLATYALFEPGDIIYSRDELPLYLLGFFKKNLVFEAHKFSSRRIQYYRRFKKAGFKIVAISEGIYKEFIKFGYDPKKLFVSHDGVDLDQFMINKTQTECRDLLRLPQDKKIVLYAGHLYEWKGAGTLLETAKLITNYQLPITKDVLFVFVGGTETDIKYFKTRAKEMGLDKVIIIGSVPHNQIPLYLKGADMVVLPNSGKEDASRLYTSPLKMFEYMTSGRPIIASDLPSIREVLNEDTAFFFQADNASDLVDVILQVINSRLEAESRAQKALDQVADYSWRIRANKIIKFLTHG